MATDIFTKVTVKDREFLIKKFDAKTGLKLARLIVAKAAPIIPLIDTDRSAAEMAEDERVFKAVGDILGTLEDKDIDNLVDKCLRVCYEDLPAGKQPVIDETGHYGIDGVEYDLTLTLRLCFEAIKWGAADFFDGNLLASIRSMK